jgi:hypothetical protein
MLRRVPAAGWCLFSIGLVACLSRPAGAAPRLTAQAAAGGAIPAASPNRTTAPPYLRWQVAALPGSDGRCSHLAMERVDGQDDVVWRRELPLWMQWDSWRCDTAGPYERIPRDRHQCGCVIVPIAGPRGGSNAWAFGGSSGLWAVREADGQVLLDLLAPACSRMQCISAVGFQLADEPACGAAIGLGPPFRDTHSARRSYTRVGGLDRRVISSI